MNLHLKHSLDTDSGLLTVYNKCVRTQTETTEGRGKKMSFNNKKKETSFFKRMSEKRADGA